MTRIRAGAFIVGVALAWLTTLGGVTATRADDRASARDDSLRVVYAGFLDSDQLKHGSVSPPAELWNGWTVDQQRACLSWLDRQRREKFRKTGIRILIESELMAEYDDGVTLIYVPPSGYEAGTRSGFRPPDGEVPPDSVRVDELPSLKSMPQPEFPAEAMASARNGVVELVVLVGKSGRVRSILVASAPPVFLTAAIRAVRRAEFAPARLNGKPVAVWVRVPIRFRY